MSVSLVDIAVRVRRWLLPFAVGLATVPLTAYIVNHSAFPDRLVRPLLRPDTVGRGDVIVVPGAGLTAACTANLNSVRRVLLAARLYREGRAPLVLFSGGRPDNEQPCAVASVMAKLAESVGVPGASIRVETTSTNTWENARFSAPLLQAAGAERLVLVTDRLHMVRVEASFARFGFSIERATVPVYEGHRNNVDMLYQGFREFAALRYYEWHGHIGDPFSPAPQRRRPSGAAASAHAPATSMNQWSYPQGPIVLLGASYVEDWGITSLAGRSVINKGVTGQESFQLLERFDADVVANRPRAVIVWGFINDVFKAPRDRVDRSIERTKESFREIVARARAANIEPVLVTEVTLRQRRSLKEDFMTLLGRWLGRSSFQDYINGHVLATNEWLREFARQEGVTLVDIQPVLSTADNRRLSEYAADDGSHFSDAGYSALTQHITPIIEARIQ